MEEHLSLPDIFVFVRSMDATENPIYLRADGAQRFLRRVLKGAFFAEQFQSFFGDLIVFCLLRTQIQLPAELLDPLDKCGNVTRCHAFNFDGFHRLRMDSSGANHPRAQLSKECTAVNIHEA